MWMGGLRGRVGSTEAQRAPQAACNARLRTPRRLHPPSGAPRPPTCSSACFVASPAMTEAYAASASASLARLGATTLATCSSVEGGEAAHWMGCTHRRQARASNERRKRAS
jgi:hypothetical protein